MTKLYVEEAGAGSPVLVLLHGLGANSAVWTPLADALRPVFPGRIVMPDLRGHGRSAHTSHYGYGHHAADVADLVAPEDDVFVVGHSMGGAVALTLASGLYGASVRAVFAFGTKLRFAAAELAKLAAVAQSPVKWFESRREAAERFLRVAGLDGIVPWEGAIATAGVSEADGRFRVAADPRTALAAGPSFDRLLVGVECPVTFACGPHDGMVWLEELRALGREALEIPDRGHNPHVEAPAQLAGILSDWLARHGSLDPAAA